MENLLHGSWSHMEAMDEDEWLEHLEEHLERDREHFQEKMKRRLRKTGRVIDGKCMTGLERNTRNLQSGSENVVIIWTSI